MAQDNRHSGHRNRLRDRARNFGMESLEEHEFLEMLLYSLVPRMNTNNIAHELIARFGSLDKVFKAPEDELKRAGIPEKAAFWLAHFHDFLDLYADISQEEILSAEQILSSAEAVVRKRCRELSESKKYKAGKLLVVCISVRGTMKSANWLEPAENTRMEINALCREARDNGAYYVVLARTAPAGVQKPTENDRAMTDRYKRGLKELQVVLLDRYHVTPEGIVSYTSIGAYSPTNEE